jgi:hypothetical protein
LLENHRRGDDNKNQVLLFETAVWLWDTFSAWSGNVKAPRATEFIDPDEVVEEAESDRLRVHAITEHPVGVRNGDDW